MKYSVTEFRKNTREILDTVDRGAEVVIQRYDREYRIIITKHPAFTISRDMELEDELDIPNPITSVAKKVAKKVNKKREEFASAGIRTDIKTELDIEKGKGTITVTPNEDDVKKFKKKAGLNIPTIDPCPHGYAKGMCKKADCNRKYS